MRPGGSANTASSKCWALAAWEPSTWPSTSCSAGRVPSRSSAPTKPGTLEWTSSQGAKAILEGWTAKDGKLPVNPSGGLKAKGHPIGATGVSMHAIAAMQLTGQAPEGMQLPKADLGGVFNMGGAAVANYVSILEPLR